MRALLSAGKSPFHIEAAVLHQEPPDLVLTQDTCAICDAAADDRIISEHFSPIMMHGAFVLPDVSVGMIDASATRKPAMAR